MIIMDYKITNVFVRNSTVIIIINVPEMNDEFSINLAKTSFEAMSNEELQYRIASIVKEKYATTQGDDVLRDKAAALMGDANDA